MKRVLFICTKNSARSQMAEGLVNHDWAGRFQAFSAGTDPSSVHPLALEVMREIGIDISSQRSKSINEFAQERFDYVISLCDQANESCPVFFGGTRRLHMGFPDPAGAEGGDEGKREAFRKVRDRIRKEAEEFLGHQAE
jgi:arsenate reductase